MMTSQELRGRLNEFKGQIREKWGQLTDDDFTQSQGNIDQLMGTIQTKTGQSREEIEKFFNSLGQGGNQATAKASEFVSQASEKVREMAGPALERAREGYDSARQYATHSVDEARHMVQDHPTQALMVALGVGAVVGLLIGMSMRSA